MSVREITLQWRFRPPQDDYDIRTFNAFVILGNGREPLHLYKVDGMTSILRNYLDLATRCSS